MLQEGKLRCKACQSANIYYGKRGWIRAGERGHLAARTEEHSVPQDENSLSNVVTPRGICLGEKKGKKKSGLPSYTTLKQLEICLPLNLHDKQRSVPCGQTWAISPPVIESGSTEQKKKRKLKQGERGKIQVAAVDLKSMNAL